MTARFEGRVALITGGAAGIGFATARRIGLEGGRVTILDWSEGDIDRAVPALEAQGIACLAVRGDVATTTECEEAVARTTDRWGRLDVLVANAGVRAFGSLVDASDEDWDRILRVNLRGVANACAASVRAMREAGNGGSMVLISSQNAIVGRSFMPIYDAAKAGVLSLARSLAVEFAPDRIRVNSLCPGFTVTDYHVRRAQEANRDPESLRATETGLFGRPAEPEEMAAAIAFLASDDASYVTATNLMVDAGEHAVGRF